MKKEYFILGLVTIILLILVYTRINDNVDNKKFLQEMTAFKNKGGRNTASMGKALCESNNETRALLNLKEDDCQAIYK